MNDNGASKPTVDELQKAYETELGDLLRVHDPAVHVFVVDDQVRFALQVHRYLSGGAVFGIGRAENLNNEFIYTSSEDEGFKQPWPLISEHGFAAIWWLPAKGEVWQQVLKVKPLKRHAKQKCNLVLIDVFGQPGEKGEKFPGEKSDMAHDPVALNGALSASSKSRGSAKKSPVKYLCQEVKEVFQKNIKAKKGRSEFLFVSSYAPGRGKNVPREVEPKSPEVLKRIRQMVWDKVQEGAEASCEEENSKGIKTGEGQEFSSEGDTETNHVLVTGHGFEVQSGETHFGLPLTVELLNQLGVPFRFGKESDSEIRLEKSEKGDFPVPVSGIWAKGYTNQEEIAKFSENRDLDGYWDFLLQTELVSRVSKSPAPSRLAKKIVANKAEHRMRNAFRRVILKYDWGHLSQYLWAVRLPWKCWLTTNYTRFADRAVEMVARQNDGPSRGSVELEGPLGWRKPKETEGDDGAAQKQSSDYKSWRIIGTAKEAAMLIKEELHNPDSGSDAHPHLFKLHGDIGQLHTMAIAGHDKEMYSLLSLPVDYLHDLYVAARTHLFARLENAKSEGRNMVWHVVGHGLYDPLLMDLIKRVVAHPKDFTSTFLVVNPYPGGPSEKLKDIFKDKGNIEIYSIPLKASQYMARVYYHGLPGKNQSLEHWLKTSKMSAERFF